MKKLLTGLIVLSFVFLLTACGRGGETPSTDIALPNLSGLTQTQVQAEFAGKLLTVVERFEASDAVAEGEFLRYGNSLSAGDEVARGTVIYVYFAQAVFVPEINTGLIISTILKGTDDNRAIEIYNASTKTIDLSHYRIEIYHSSTEAIIASIDLEGTLAATRTYVITPEDYIEAELAAKANLKTNDLVFYGSQNIALLFHDDTVLDYAGVKGFNVNYSGNLTLVRQMGINEGSLQYDEDEWIIYRNDFYNALGSHPRALANNGIEGYDGPGMVQEYFQRDFLDERGGYAEVTLNRCVDGDTAVFNFPSTLVNRWPNRTSNYDRVRFFGIDTPESAGVGGVQEWGIPASDYACSILLNATNIHVQSDPGSGISDLFGRTLGWIWVDGMLLNYIMVAEGYSPEMSRSMNHRLFYDDISLPNWIILAERYPRQNGLKIWGEPDPTWPY